MEADLPNSQDSSMIDQSQEVVVQHNQPSQSSDISAQEQGDKFQENKGLSPSTQSTKNPFQPLEQRRLRYKQKLSQSKTTRLNFFMCSMQQYFLSDQLRNALDQSYNLHSIIGQQDQDRIRFSKIFKEMFANSEYNPMSLGLTVRESRGIGAVLGMGIGDALGSCTEFHHFKKQGLGIVKTGFQDLYARFTRSGKVSVWTDDASMGLCMADCILLNDYVFNPTHMRYMFVLWLQHGLNNGGRNYSIGLGGNISISMYEFMKNQSEYTAVGDRFNNGNGSLMRLAPVPVAYSHNLQEGIKYSGNQSLTTHNGLQAEECSKLMANIIIELINRDPSQDGKETILRVCDQFKSPARSVQFLAQGKQESEQFYAQNCRRNPKYKIFNKTLQDRMWNWREEDFTYAPTRLNQQPGYIGSYCMDALAMALHTVMFSKSFAEVVIKNADMGGDCDTVGSIAGQIAGALYGIDQEMLRLYSEMEDCKYHRYQVFLKGYKLINRKTI